jgi:hypothetical protein
MRGKKLTFRMKKYIGDKMRLDPDEWNYIKNTSKEFIIKNRNTGEERIIDKVEHNITLF